MLKKLLKYDLYWIYKVVIVFYILSLVFSCIARMLSLIDNSSLFIVITNICYGTAISMMISSLINCIMRLWARFIKNLYKEESYLTHTLPIKIKTIYLSKVLTSIITLFTTFAVILICLFICFYSKENIDFIKSLLELVETTYNITIIKIIILFSLVVFIEFILIIILGYVGIIIGHKSNQNKMVKSIIISIILYFATQAITLIIMLLASLFNSDIKTIITTTNLSSINIIYSIIYIAIILYTSYTLVFYLIGKKQLEQGVNIE